jgi:hypothetical protein
MPAVQRAVARESRPSKFMGHVITFQPQLGTLLAIYPGTGDEGIKKCAGR